MLRVKQNQLLQTEVSTKDETMHVTFAALGHVGHIVTDDGSKQDEQVLVNVTCLPLYSILMALDNPTVDYFSLDVEGFELDILKTIPFDKVDIKVPRPVLILI